MRRIKHVCPLSLGRFDRGLVCTCRGKQQPSLPALHGQMPPVHAVHAAKRWHCKYLWYANPYSAWRRCILLLSAIHSQPPGPSSPPMFHVSTCCSPTIANVEAAQFERSCTKQLIIHQSGSNAQVPLMDHVSVSQQPFNPQTSAAYGSGRTWLRGPWAHRQLTGCAPAKAALGFRPVTDPRASVWNSRSKSSRPRARAGDLHRASADHQEGRVKRQQPRGSCTTLRAVFLPQYLGLMHGEFRTHPSFILEWNLTIASSAP